MQRTVVHSVTLLWLGQFVWRQAQSILRWKCTCRFTHTFNLTQLQHLFFGKAFAQTTVTGSDPTHTVMPLQLQDRSTVFIPTNSKQYKTAVL